MFLTEPMREALELLQQTAALRTVMLLSGPNGVGKSALVSSWLRALEPKRFFPIVITHATLTGTGLLCTLLARLGQEPSTRRSESLQRIETAVRGLEKVIPVLVLDEAQHYSAGSLEEIRLLLDLNLPRRPLFALVLIGDSYLLDSLRLQSRRALYSRIAVSYQLGPFTAEQTEAYLRHRLEAAGIHRDGFEPAALEILTAASDGIARTINLLAATAWIEAAKQKAKSIEPAHLQIALGRVPSAREKIALAETPN
jgi:type II secretory pathway predicted ATPase ExeA